MHRPGKGPSPPRTVSPVSLATASAPAPGAGGRRRNRAPPASHGGLAAPRPGPGDPVLAAAEAGAKGRAAREPEGGRAAGSAVCRAPRLPRLGPGGDGPGFRGEGPHGPSLEAASSMFLGLAASLLADVFE